MPGLKIRIFDVVIIVFLITGLVAEIYMLKPPDWHRRLVFGLYVVVGLLGGFVQAIHQPDAWERLFIIICAVTWCALLGATAYIAALLLGTWPDGFGLIGAAAGGLVLAWLYHRGFWY